jgi:hypothetical protein
MPLKRFTPDSDTESSKDLETLFYNYGLAVYVAQLFEGALGILIVASEALGMLTVDRQTLGIESVLDRCVGPNLKILEESGLMDKEMKRALKKANMLRNRLIHRFVLENMVDLSTPLGRQSVNDQLERIYSHIRISHEMIQALNNTLLSKLGYDEKWASAQFNELKQSISDHDLEIPDKPYEARVRVTERPDDCA